VPSPLPTVVPAIGRSPDGFEVSTTYRSQAVARVPGLDSLPHRLCEIPVHAFHRGSGTWTTLLGRGSGTWATLAPVPA
jgi:hypothetical protein